MRPDRPRWLWMFFVVSTPLVLGLAATSVRSTAVLLCGAIGPVLLGFLATRVRRLKVMVWQSPWRRLLLWTTAGLGLGSVVIATYLHLRSVLPVFPYQPPPALFISGYSLELRPMDQRLRAFRIRETLTLREAWAQKYVPADRPPALERPTRTVDARRLGLLLWECRVQPPASDSSGYARHDAASAWDANEFILAYMGATVSVEARDLPKHAFQAARYATEVHRTPYGGTETVAWSVRSAEDGIAFAFLPAPCFRLRYVLAPFIKADELGQGLFVVIGLGISMVLYTLAKPLAVDFATERLKEWGRRLAARWHKRSRRRRRRVRR